MDLVGRVGDDLEILDYKSHKLAPGDEPAAAAKYALQRDLYAEALGAILGKTPARFTFYFPETDRPVVSELDAARSGERLALIDRLLTLDPSAPSIDNSTV
jgi:RecB family exonuclease